MVAKYVLVIKNLVHILIPILIPINWVADFIKSIIAKTKYSWSKSISFVEASTALLKRVPRSEFIRSVVESGYLLIDASYYDGYLNPIKEEFSEFIFNQRKENSSYQFSFGYYCANGAKL